MEEEDDGGLNPDLEKRTLTMLVRQGTRSLDRGRMHSQTKMTKEESVGLMGETSAAGGDGDADGGDQMVESSVYPATEASHEPARTKSYVKKATMAQLLEVLRLRDELTPAAAARILADLRTAATRSVLGVLSRSFSTTNPGGEPHSAEAKRQLMSFCGSLRNTTLTKPPPLRAMKSVTVFTPHCAPATGRSASPIVARLPITHASRPFAASLAHSSASISAPRCAPHRAHPPHPARSP